MVAVCKRLAENWSLDYFLSSFSSLGDLPMMGLAPHTAPRCEVLAIRLLIIGFWEGEAFYECGR